MTGRDLRLRRVASGLKVYEVAIAMSVHASRISQIEALAEVTPFTENRFVAAIASAVSKKAAKQALSAA